MLEILAKAVKKCTGTSSQGGRKEGRRNEPVGSCAMCDAQSNGFESAREQEPLKNGGSKQNFVAYTKFTITDER